MKAPATYPDEPRPGPILGLVAWPITLTVCTLNPSHDIRLSVTDRCWCGSILASYGGTTSNTLAIGGAV